MPWTTAAIASPTRVTRSPDARPLARSPGVEDLPSPADVLGEIQGDERRMGQRPFDRTRLDHDAAATHGRNGSNSHAIIAPIPTLIASLPRCLTDRQQSLQRALEHDVVRLAKELVRPWTADG